MPDGRGSVFLRLPVIAAELYRLTADAPEDRDRTPGQPEEVKKLQATDTFTAIVHVDVLEPDHSPEPRHKDARFHKHF
ncbi:MAG: hypothetical protein NTV49_07815 [Kiritimatiellaeota bacterium]|nr:hypothetical protein [Kiritimatiellota bacterium]